MKAILVAMLSCGICAANQVSRPIRVSLQYVGMAHPVMTDMLGAGESRGDLLHAKAMALAKQGKAEILETCVLVCRSGNMATAESIREEIFPIHEFDVDLPIEAQLQPFLPTLRPTPTAFETRNTGVTFEIEPTIGDGQLVDLRLVPEVVTPVRLENWFEHKDRWGDASIRMPVYETWRTNSAITLQPGKFELISIITPKLGAPVPTVSRRILVFVRADIIPVPVESP